jgi:hypothetical protein
VSLRSLGLPKPLQPHTGHFEKTGDVYTSGQASVGNQNVPNPPAYSSGKGLEVKDSFEKSATTGGVSTSGETHGVDFNAHAEGPTLSMEGQAKAKVSAKGIDIHAQVNIDATLVQAGAGAHTSIPVTLPGGEQVQVNVDLSAAGAVGAKGNLNVDIHIGTNGQVTAAVHADGFAGAKASLTGAVSLTHGNDVIAKADATLSAYAGVAGAVDFHASVGLHGVDFGATAAASAGAGFGVELNGEFDPMAAAKLAGAIALDAAKGGLESGVHGVETGVNNAGHAIGDAAGHVGDVVGSWF